MPYFSIRKDCAFVGPLLYAHAESLPKFTNVPECGIPAISVMRTMYDAMSVEGGEYFCSAQWQTVGARKKFTKIPTVQPSLSDEDTMLCNSWIQGYSLKNKMWGHFEVAKIQEVGFNDEAFNNLVLPEEKKDLILSLVQQQDDNGDGFDDLIKGKGKGLIFLLHGPPGVGKTFTAGKGTASMPNLIHD